MFKLCKFVQIFQFLIGSIQAFGNDGHGPGKPSSGGIIRLTSNYTYYYSKEYQWSSIVLA